MQTVVQVGRCQAVVAGGFVGMICFVWLVLSVISYKHEATSEYGIVGEERKGRCPSFLKISQTIAAADIHGLYGP